MDQTASLTLTGYNVHPQIATLEGLLTSIQAQPAHGHFCVVAFQTRLFEDGLNVFDEVDSPGGGGRQF